MTERRRHTTTGGFPGPFDIRIHLGVLPAKSSFYYVAASVFKGYRSRDSAMESGIVDHLFSFKDLVGIVDEWEVSQRTERAAEA
jgi:hypothetical protein